MKRKLRVRGRAVIAFISMVVMIFCVGCGNNSDMDKSTKQETEKKTETLNKNVQKAGETYKLEQGSFVIPEGWKLHEGDSTAEKPFFIPENSDSDNPSGIISVQYMTNHYSKDDSQTLAESILWQLNMQLKGHLSGEVTASGTSSKEGYTVLVYNFTADGTANTQYYILGDHCHVMVYATNVSGTEDVDTAAKRIVDTYKWK